ncbi:DUF6266 family protein [Pedobacter sp. L105]|uniref:DUF6266 family protein n=1 Tax=Pedobacter sp. L105 TaxID=1641871 RepID=UPI00131BE429|nr:DUF6266 family protein [Pedobacter sp. L105]
MGIRTKAPIIGDISGKVGTVVLSTWRGLNIIKEVPSTRKNKKVPEKVAQQNGLFKIVSQFLEFSGNDIIKRGYQLRKKENMTAFNFATSYHMLNAVTGTFPNFSIDLSKVKFSRPLNSTQKGWNAVFIEDENGDLKVKWELNPFPKKTTQLDDEAVVIFYNATRGNFRISYDVQRSSLGYIYPVKRQPSLVGHEIFSWLFFISADGKLVSETTYLGMLKMI